MRCAIGALLIYRSTIPVCSASHLQSVCIIRLSSITLASHPISSLNPSRRLREPHPYLHQLGRPLSPSPNLLRMVPTFVPAVDCSPSLPISTSITFILANPRSRTPPSCTGLSSPLTPSPRP